MFAATSIEIFVAAQPVMDLCERLHITNQYLIQGCALLAVITAAWVISPAALRLLRPLGNTNILPTQKAMARWAGTLAVTTSAVLQWFYEAFRHNIKVDSAFEGVTVGMLATVLSNAPLLLLFIALAVISLNKLETLEPLPDGSMAEGGRTP